MIASREAYEEAASTLAPTAVSQYLASQDWQLERRDDSVREIWKPPGHDDPRARIMLPLATDYVDFRQRFRDALYAIGVLHDWDPGELQTHIQMVRADLLFIRLDQTMTDGTIPFRQAEQTIGAINKLLRSAATTTANPEHPQRGRLPANVTEFLDEDVRLGHTKPGSFIFTIVTRLQSDIDVVGSEDGAVQVSEHADRLGGIQPFARQVMETVARGLETTQSLARGEKREALDNPAQWGLSAGFVESLEAMTQPEGLRSVDLSFEWSAASPKPPVGHEKITFDRALTPALSRVRERLVRREEPPRHVNLIGLVRRLEQGVTETDGDDLGSVTIFADVDQRMRNVTMSLEGDARAWALRAYDRRLPLNVEGDLVFERGAWRLMNAVVDSSFLEQQLAREPENGADG